MYKITNSAAKSQWHKSHSVMAFDTEMDVYQ